MKINNKDARRLWLWGQGLAGAPTGALDAAAIIRSLGFVQLDTIQNVTRAHHHIMWSRNQNYREPVLDKMLRQDRAVFEHFTHDASVLPIEFYPMWQRQFERLGAKVRGSAWHRSGLKGADYDVIKARIANEGPLSTRDFDTKIVGKKEMWARPPHKKALDLMWYEGTLTTSHRENFIKFYDLAERVIPPVHRNTIHSDLEQIDWLCRQALVRMQFGTLGDIQRFWAAVDAAEVKTWASGGGTNDFIMPAEIEGADGGWSQTFVPHDIAARLDAATPPAPRMRIINPFDPVVRDRKRLERLFGFNYTNEMFVPKAKRQWGYYVYPLLEGTRFVGRMELKADRKTGVMTVANLWREARVKWTDARADKLDAELMRFAHLAGLKTVEWTCARTPD
ncbi:winged helix-turn-helix domain-containing protein [Kordiimonas aquimaris]|uniref:winged helix-turn-helix domain-containing protein n=1 Tax=Kordiimonas aquimaris TaxID=707591 RepID=UPI0021D02DBF|nr:crosslink repair DNA glycosylase YcaQ family protein [Kordiimonas aquimaris]